MNRRYIYKLELACVKYVPILIAIISLINVILHYFAYCSVILDIVAGNSILTVFPMYVSSYVYKFCKYHRMFIHYILVNNIIDLYDELFYIPWSDSGLFAFYLTLAGVFAIVILYLYLKYGDRQDK